MYFLLNIILLIWLFYADIIGGIGIEYCSGGPIDNYMSDSEPDNITSDQTNFTENAELDRLRELRESTRQMMSNLEQEKNLTLMQMRILSGTREHARFFRLHNEISAEIRNLIRTEHRINRQIRRILRNRYRNP